MAVTGARTGSARPASPLVRDSVSPVRAAASQEAAAMLGSQPEGLTPGEASERLARVGPNAVREHRARAVTRRAFPYSGDRADA